MPCSKERNLMRGRQKSERKWFRLRNLMRRKVKSKQLKLRNFRCQRCSKERNLMRRRQKSRQIWERTTKIEKFQMPSSKIRVSEEPRYFQHMEWWKSCERSNLIDSYDLFDALDGKPCFSLLTLVLPGKVKWSTGTIQMWKYTLLRICMANQHNGGNQ